MTEKRKQQRYDAKLRYYRKTATNAPVPWTKEQDKLVLTHEITDAELSNEIGHSVQAIHIRRTRLKGGKI